MMSFFQRTDPETGDRKILPAALTNYDLLKCAALLLMVVDHIGFYFYPDDNWWRVFGRMCVPIWFFLVGYARSRDIGPAMWAGMIVLIVSSAVSGMNIFAVNILATIIIVRMLIDRVGVFMLRGDNDFWRMNVLLALLVVPSMMIVEYGTQGMILALVGYFVRALADGRVDRKLVTRQMGFAAGTYAIFQYMVFMPTQPQFIVMTAGVALIVMGLTYFRPHSFAITGAGVLRVVTAPLRFLGRHTLAFYVWHIVLFQGIGMVIDPERFSFMNWVWFSS